MFNTNAELIKRTKGVPGALEFIVILMKSMESVSMGTKGILIIATIQRIPELSGEDIYMLWSKLGKKDLKRVHSICEKIPLDIIKYASSKRDDSGLKIIDNYLKNKMDKK